MKNSFSRRIVFMGTPDFAVESLRRLVEGGYDVVGVVTMPDRAVGKHHSTVQPSAVKVYAMERGLTVLQPEKLREEIFLQQLRELRADLQIVVAFRMLPEVVWNMPALGTFNLHASLLPQYRGAAPINWAIINGERVTGVTTFFLNHEIDRGRIIMQRRLEIADTDDAGAVHDALMVMGAELTVETVNLIFDNRAEAVPQDVFYDSIEDLRPAPKIFNDTCRIDWGNGVKRCYDFIRGLSPYPSAWTEMVFPDKSRYVLKIYGAEKVFEEHDWATGTLISGSRNVMDVAVPDGFIRLNIIQLAGKKRMNAADFLNGFRLPEGVRIE